MEIGVIVELIGTLGFPIACVLALGIFVFKIWQQSVTREERLMTELAETRIVNTQAIETIAHYAERLETIQEDVKEIKTDIAVIMNK